MPFPLQHTEGDETTGDMMQLSPLRTRLTATEPEVILTRTDDFFNVRPHSLAATDLHGWQCQAIGGVILGAVSDVQDF
jgi:hypothetical protein